MKILYIAPSFIPSRSANSVHVMKMCHAIAKLGHKVSLLTRGNNDNQISDYDYYGVKPNFKLYKFKGNDYRYISSLIYSIYIFRKIKKINPELIYTRHRFSLIVTRYFTNIPVIFEDHSPPSGIYKSIIENSINRNICKIVLISEELKKLYKKVVPSIINVKVIVAHDASDPIIDNNLNHNYLKIDKTKFNCGYVGHLYKGRGIEIIHRIAKQFSDVIFHIVGGYEDDIKYWRKNNTLKNLIFHGYLSNEKIPDTLSQFEILLAPYQYEVQLKNKQNTAQWMSPLKIFEYMAAGKSIICSNLKVIKEVLVDGDNALLLDPGKVDEWVASVTRLFSDESLRKKLGQKAKSDFLNHYTWSKRAKKIINA